MRIIRIAQTIAFAPKKRSNIIHSFISGRSPTSRVPTLRNILEEINNISMSGDISLWTGTSHKVVYLHDLAYLRSLYSVNSNIKAVIDQLSPGLIALVDSGSAGDKNLTTLRGTRVDDIYADFADIVSSSSSRGSTKALQYPMFRELLGKFSNDIKASANSTGNTALANAINNNGLINPAAFIQQKFNLGKPLGHMYSTTNQLINEIMSRRYVQTPISVQQNCMLVKEAFMKSVGNYGVKQEGDTELKRQMEDLKRINDPSKMAPGAKKPVELAAPVNFEDKKMTDPLFVMSMVIFFTEYAKKINSLPA